MAYVYHRLGSIPGADFIDGGQPKGLRLGMILRVDEVTMKVDVKVMTGGGYRMELELTQGMCGPRSFWGGIPEVGSIVLIGYRSIHKDLGDAVIIGYIPVGNRLGYRFDPFSSTGPVEPDDLAEVLKTYGSNKRIKRLRLQPGDVGGMSSSGAELVLNKSVSMVNRAGDLLELRDEERTIVSQALHRFDATSGVKHYNGPVRRQSFYLPSDVVVTDGSTKRVKSETEGYYGTDDLANLGPGLPAGAPTKFATSDGSLLPNFNDTTLYPPVVYSNGKTVFYPSTLADKGIEGNVDRGVGNPFVEVRTEVLHSTDLVQEVHGEIDGFTVNPRKTHVEQVLGTVVGNDPYSDAGIRQYGAPLRPQLWTSGRAQTEGKFTLQPCDRRNGDSEVRTGAAAYLLRIFALDPQNDDNPFAVAVQKQGKLLVNIPRPATEFYSDAVQGISADLNVLGAIKMFVGRASPTNTSIFAKIEGGIKAEIGVNSDTGNSIDVIYNGPVRAQFVGPGDADGNGAVIDVSGNYQMTVSGDYISSTGGSINQTASGAFVSQADKIVQTAINGFTLNSAGYQKTVMGLSTLTYAMLKTEVIAAGGELKTIVAGPSVETLTAGAKTITVASGPIAITAGAAITTSAGAALSMTAGGAFTASAGASASITAGAAISMTAGVAMTMTAPAGIMLTSVNVQLGGPPGVLGVVRGAPALPPGAPSLDSLTGLPLLGGAAVRSI